MCTFESPTEVMVCDVARDRVRRSVGERLGAAASFETVHGQGTRVTCLDAARASEFGEAVRLAVDEEARVQRSE